MSSKNKSARGNDYYFDLLERKHPVVFRDLQAGKYKTVAEALKFAGVKKDRTPLQELLPVDVAAQNVGAVASPRSRAWAASE